MLRGIAIRFHGDIDVVSGMELLPSSGSSASGSSVASVLSVGSGSSWSTLTYLGDDPISEDTLLPPPRPLSLAARKVWDAYAGRVHSEGRWSVIDHDMLCLYAETCELNFRFKADIDEHGTLVQGRTLQEKVRNPSLMGLAQARTDLIRLAKAIPLVDPKPDTTGIEVDKFLEEMMAYE